MNENALVWVVVGGLLMSGIALVGSLTLVVKPAMLERLLLPLVSLAAGTLLGGAVLHMVPTGLAVLGAVDAGAWLLAGFATFLGLEQFLHWHHCRQPGTECGGKPVIYLILLGDALHNFLGGLGIASTFLVDRQAGIMAWLAAAAHEVPQELGDFGVLVHGGWSRRRALFWNLISGLTFLLGALLAFVLSTKVQLANLIMFGAGNFIYIAASDLVPEIKAHPEMRRATEHFLCFAAGVLLMFYLAHLFHHQPGPVTP